MYWFTISSCYFSIPLTLGLIGRDGGLSILCHIYKFACQQRVLKTFPGPGYLHSEDGVVWLRHYLVNLYIWLTISSCYGSISLTLGLIGRDGDLSALCCICGFACQHRVLKTFPEPGYLCSEDGGSLSMAFNGKFVYIYICVCVCVGVGVGVGVGGWVHACVRACVCLYAGLICFIRTVWFISI